MGDGMSGYIDISVGELLRRARTTIVMEVGGTGLEPDLLKGDQVLVDLTRRTPKRGDVVVVKVLGGYLAGRWGGRKKRRLLLATHPLTRFVDLSLHDAWEIVGTVTTVVGREIGRPEVGVRMTVVRGAHG